MSEFTFRPTAGRQTFVSDGMDIDRSIVTTLASQGVVTLAIMGGGFSLHVRGTPAQMREMARLLLLATDISESDEFASEVAA